MEGGNEFDLKALDADENVSEGTRNNRTNSESQATKRCGSFGLIDTQFL
jgi:hypothetical protein